MFVSAAIAHLLAVMSPGPDTAIIFQQSFAKGRKSGILTAVGIGTGIFLHCLLAISGISILLYSTEEARFIIKISINRLSFLLNKNIPKIINKGIISSICLDNFILEKGTL